MDKNKILKLLLFIIAPLILLLLVIGLVLSSFFSLPKTDLVEVKTEKNTTQISNKKTNSNPTKEAIKDEKLQREIDALLPLFGMPSVPVFIKDEPITAGAFVQDGVAYNICEDRKPTIFVKKAFYEKANQKQLVNILKHELVHAWFCRLDIKADHDERFRKKFKEVGGFGN